MSSHVGLPDDLQNEKYHPHCMPTLMSGDRKFAPHVEACLL